MTQNLLQKTIIANNNYYYEPVALAA